VKHAYVNTVVKSFPSNNAQCQSSHTVYLVLQEVINSELHKIFVAIMLLIMYMTAFQLSDPKLFVSFSVCAMNL
jgi:hypothetical protein